jgi:hypothetical protein
MFKWPILRRNSGLGKILSNEDIDPTLVLKLEQSEFGGEGKDPSETLEGILVFKELGKILKPENIEAYAESIRLEDLFLCDINRLHPNSPLRMIVETDRRNGVLNSVRDDYPGRQSYHYSHGVVVSEKGKGYGSALFRERLKMLIGEKDLMFGFIMAYLPNIPAIRMALRKNPFTTDGAVIDKLQDGVYEPGVKYFRWIYDKRMAYGRREGTISLEDTSKIASALNAGYVATKFEEPNKLFFNRRF